MIAMPGISDAALLDALLAHADKLTTAQLESFVALAEGVAIGTRLLRGDRDRAMATARAFGLLPPIEEKKRVMRALHSDPYSERRTSGTEYADKVLARRPSRPPRAAQGGR